MTEVLGLTPDQHYGLGMMLLQSHQTVRGADPDPGRRRYPGACRVLCLGPNDPVYTPKEVREAAIFEFRRGGSQQTVELSGSDMQGKLDVTVGEASATVDCQVTTAELRDALGLSLRDCRITVFPAYWEFDFNSGRFAERPPTVQVSASEPPEESEDPVFDGGIRTRAEAWVSMTSDGDTFETIETTDWIPHLSGSIKAGSIGGAVWSHEAGWLVVAWQCREWSFAA